jgi:hypothetical protein
MKHTHRRACGFVCDTLNGKVGMLPLLITNPMLREA